MRSCAPSPSAAPRRIAESKAPPTIGDRRRQGRAIIALTPARAGGNDSQQPGGISEDVLARLRAAESEAAKLREQLAKVQARLELERTRFFSLPSTSPPPPLLSVSLSHSTLSALPP